MTGKYGVKTGPDSGRLIENKVYNTRYGAGWMYQTAEDFTRFAEENGFNPVSLAVAWVASHPDVTAPIIGARSVEQLKGSIAAVDIKMTPELRQAISALSPEPPPATDRNEERTPHTLSSR